MGKLVDWMKGIIRGLAFFPVVAISSNLSTKILQHKGSKKKTETPKILYACKMPEYLFKIALNFLK